MCDPVILATAKAIWACRPGSEIVRWDKLPSASRTMLITDAKDVINAYKTAVMAVQYSDAITVNDGPDIELVGRTETWQIRIKK